MGVKYWRCRRHPEINHHWTAILCSEQIKEPAEFCRVVFPARPQSGCCRQNRRRANQGFRAKIADLSKKDGSPGNGAHYLSCHVSLPIPLFDISGGKNLWVQSMRQWGQSRKTGISEEWRDSCSPWTCSSPCSPPRTLTNLFCLKTILLAAALKKIKANIELGIFSEEENCRSTPAKPAALHHLYKRPLNIRKKN